MEAITKEGVPNARNGDTSWVRLGGLYALWSSRDSCVLMHVHCFPGMRVQSFLRNYQKGMGSPRKKMNTLKYWRCQHDELRYWKRNPTVFDKHATTHTREAWLLAATFGGSLLKARREDVTVGTLPGRTCTLNLFFFFCLRLLFSLKLSVL